MMKLAALVLLAFLGAANATLEDDFAEFMALIPFEEINHTVTEFREVDEEVREAYAFLETDQYKRLKKSVEASRELADLVEFFREFDLDLYSIINGFHAMLQLPDICTPPLTRVIHQSGVAGLAHFIMSSLPLGPFFSLINEKYKTSSEFQRYWDGLKSGRFQNLVDRLLAQPDLQKIIQKGRDFDLPFDASYGFVAAILGWQTPKDQSF